MKTKIMVFNLRKRKFDTLEIEPIINEEVSKVIKENMKGIGLEIEIKRIDNAELFVRKFYERQGFTVKRLEPQGFGRTEPLGDDYKKVIDCLESYEIYDEDSDKELLDKWLTFMKASGVPDFLVYRLKDDEVSELFFVECKSSNDVLRISQLIWISMSNVPVKIVYLEEH